MKKTIFIFSLILMTACGDKKEKTTANTPDLPVRFVKYTIVQKQSDISERDFSGSIVTDVLSTLSFRVPGTIEKRYVDFGNSVDKGQLLAELDPTDYLLQYKQAHAQRAKAKASFVDASANLLRDKTLYLENSISLARYQSTQAAYEASKAELESSISAEEYQNKQLQYTKLYASASGTISQVSRQPGESVSPDTPVFSLNTSGDLEILFNVSEAAVSQLKTGDIINFNVDALRSLPLQATITNIGTVSTGFGNTYPVKAKINDSPEDIKVGMTVTATLKTSPYYIQSEKIFIPAEVVMIDNRNQSFVFTLKKLEDGEGVVEKKLISLGAPLSSGIEVEKGLIEGDLLIIDGYNRIAEGEKVEAEKEVTMK